MSRSPADTIVALATPPGIGAIGVIRISGENSITIVQSIFRGKDLQSQASHTVHYGHIMDAGQVLDEVVVTLFKAPNSFTKENVIEIGCHGSEYILRRVIMLLVQQGARLAEPGEFTQRAFLNGRFDLVQAEAVADLIESESAAAHKLAIDQMRGGFSKMLQASRESLIEFAAMIELELDFGEEDVEFASRSDLKALILNILNQIQPLMDSFALGNAIKNGIPVVLAGKPNAGKSTLLNALLNEERAIVSDIAGTTRDTIEENLNIQGVVFKLIDTAGLRDAQDQIEAIGISKSLEKVALSTYLLFLCDASEIGTDALLEELRQLGKSPHEVLVIATKMDQSDTWDGSAEYLKMEGYHCICISAAKKLHLDTLKQKLYDLAIHQSPSSGDIRISNLRHFEALNQTAKSLESALDNLDAGLSGDLLAQPIRHALYHLGVISGAVSTDDLLEYIFSKFCIGK
ncbi:MAG: tRNA uridine-5-carboxymethylaminomethyl(34) synthesis GTPase MnmE [Saprospiraceae bacterium]